MNSIVVGSQKAYAAAVSVFFMGNPIGIIIVLFGLIGTIWPYKLARFNEQMDSIGSRRRFSDVEPAGWNVALTRVVGVVMVIIGVILLAGG